MLKIKFIILLIIGIHVLGYSQWEEKNVSTSTFLNSVHFLNDEVGFVTGSNKIYKTEDGGDDWQLIYLASDLVLYEDILAINEDQIIAVGKDFNLNQSLISISNNGGESWTDILLSGSSLLKSVKFVSSEIGYCSGEKGALFKTTDAGLTWQSLNSGTDLYLQSIFFIDELLGFAVGGVPSTSLIIKTMDGGETWSPIQSPSDNYLQSVFFTNRDTGYIVGWNGEILKTENCGDSWTSQNSVEMSGNLEVTFTDTNTGYIVGGSFNEPLIQKTSNAGDLWEDISPDIQEGLVGIFFPSFNIGNAVGGNGTVIKTVSGGISTSTKQFDFIDEFKIYPNPSNGLINIHSENSKQIEKIKIHDSLGRIIKESNPNSANSTMDLSNIEPNIYYLEIHSEGIRSVKKIVKK